MIGYGIVGRMLQPGRVPPDPWIVPESMSFLAAPSEQRLSAENANRAAYQLDEMVEKPYSVGPVADPMIEHE